MRKNDEIFESIVLPHPYSLAVSNAVVHDLEGKHHHQTSNDGICSGDSGDNVSSHGYLAVDRTKLGQSTIPVT